LPQRIEARRHRGIRQHRCDEEDEIGVDELAHQGG
jgi:hypothetical protein